MPPAKLAQKKSAKGAKAAGNPTRRRLGVGAGLVVVIIGGGIYFSTQSHNSTPPAPTKPVVHVPVVPLRVTSITPAQGASDVSYSSGITIHFSAALAKRWSTPVVTPSVAGTWKQVNHTTLSFNPSGNFVPSSTVHITIPAGIGSTQGTTLTAEFTSDFTVESGSTTRLQQLLAELDYLPVAFVAPNSAPASTPSAGTNTGTASTNTGSTVAASVSGASGVTNTGVTGVSGTSGNSGTAGTPTTSGTSITPLPTSTAALDAEPTDASLVPLSAQPGTFAWRFSNIPSQLSALWSPGAFDVVTQGAVMAFESEHGLSPDGEPGPAVWTALLQAVATRSVTTRPYDYLMASESLPESLFVWRQGQIVFSTRVNSGVTGAATALGTWPVYLKYTSATMTGTNPDGTHYTDPGIPWISYFNGNDAVHGFVRASYGFPQSDGCIEVPVANAAIVYPMDPYGTLVTITTGDLAAEFNEPVPPPYYT